MTMTGLWSEEDGYFYDIVRLDNGEVVPLRIRSMVGLVPAVALLVVDAAELNRSPTFRARIDWFLAHRSNERGYFGRFVEDDERQVGLLSCVSAGRLQRILRVALDESEL